MSAGDAEQPESGTVTACCAPGRTVLSALALMLKGEHADRIVEHPWLEGFDCVILAPELEKFRLGRPDLELVFELARIRACFSCGAPEPEHNAWCMLRASLPLGPLSLVTGA